MGKFPRAARAVVMALAIGLTTGASGFVSAATAHGYGYAPGYGYRNGEYHGGEGSHGGYHGGGGGSRGGYGGGGATHGGYGGGGGGNGNGQSGDSGNGVRVHCGAIVAGKGPVCR